MRASKLGFAIMLALAATPALASGGGGPVKKGPEGIPFTCSDGRSLRVVYERDGPRGGAELRFVGDETLHLDPSPAMTGARYAHETATGALIVWATDGINGWLIETTPQAPMEGRELARCDRLGWGSALDTSAPHAEEAHAEAH